MDFRRSHQINDHNFNQADVNEVRIKSKWQVFSSLESKNFYGSGLGYESIDSIMDLVEDKKLSDSLQSMHVGTPGE